MAKASKKTRRPKRKSSRKKVNTIESLQVWLKAKGFNPGPIDGLDGPLTFAAWSAFLKAAPLTTNNGVQVSKDALANLLARAKADVGVLSTSDDSGTDNGQLGCADAVTRILHDELGFSLPKTLSTEELFDELVAAAWIKIDLLTPGAVIVSPSCAAMHGHTGIVGENGLVYSNSSATGRWTQNWTVAGWLDYYARCGSYAFGPPQTATVSQSNGSQETAASLQAASPGAVTSPQAGTAQQAGPPSQAAAPAQPGSATSAKPFGFAPLGPQAPIRGQFAIASNQMFTLCTGKFAPYSLYAAAIVEDSTEYGINPLFVLADLVNQGVNPAYRNPWGISTDNYPYGPDGKQLGQPNGRIKNGPRQFSEDEWRIAFDRQFAVVASGHAYSTATTIAQWALIDAPPGAANDVHGTNGEEAADVGALYNLLVTMLG
jgi:hypothetical protein